MLAPGIPEWPIPESVDPLEELLFLANLDDILERRNRRRRKDPYVGKVLFNWTPDPNKRLDRCWACQLVPGEIWLTSNNNPNQVAYCEECHERLIMIMTKKYPWMLSKLKARRFNKETERLAKEIGRVKQIHDHSARYLRDPAGVAARREQRRRRRYGGKTYNPREKADDRIQPTSRDDLEM